MEVKIEVKVKTKIKRIIEIKSIKVINKDKRK